MVKSRRMSLCLAYSTLAHQDVNLKMPRNNQLLHFAFREDKQWKLQQVNQALPWPELRPQGQAGTGLHGTKASRGWPMWGFIATTASLGRCFLAAKLGWAGPVAPGPSLLRGGEPICRSPGPSKSHKDTLEQVTPCPESSQASYIS